MYYSKRSWHYAHTQIRTNSFILYTGNCTAHFLVASCISRNLWCSEHKCCPLILVLLEKNESFKYTRKNERKQISALATVGFYKCISFKEVWGRGEEKVQKIDACSKQSSVIGKQCFFEWHFTRRMKSRVNHCYHKFS